MFEKRLLKIWLLVFFSSLILFLGLFYISDHFNEKFNPKSQGFISQLLQEEQEGQRNSTFVSFTDKSHLSALKLTSYKRTGKKKSTLLHSTDKTTRFASKSQRKPRFRQERKGKATWEHLTDTRSRFALKSQRNLSFRHAGKIIATSLHPTVTSTSFTLKSQRNPSVDQEGQIIPTSLHFADTMTSFTSKSQRNPSVDQGAQIIPTSLQPTNTTTRLTLKSQRNPSVNQEEQIIPTSLHPTDTSTRSTLKSETNPTIDQGGQIVPTSLHPTHISTHFTLKSQKNPSVDQGAQIIPTSLHSTDTSTRFTLKSQTNHVINQVGNIKPVTTDKHPRVVLIYTAFFGDYPWKGLEDTQKFTNFKGKPCRVQNCIVSYKKEDFPSSDVVIFHGRDLPTVTTLHKLHNKRPPNQAWVFFILESPAHSPDTGQYDGLFNWTMTYRRDSDVYHPYGFYTPLEANDKKPDMSKDYSLGKDKLIVWTVGNCAGKRFSYVDKLKHFVKVDIFGACGSNGCPRNSKSCSKHLGTYKFQLAFENTECVDYVTEKYWGSPLENGIVPIVMGGADYKKIAIPGSYINVLDFPSIKALADYLLYLDKNNTAYNEYFHWKTKYKLGGVLRGGLTGNYPWTCDLCALVNDASVESKVYEHLDNFWSGKQCNLFSKQFDRIIN